MLRLHCGDVIPGTVVCLGGEVVSICLSSVMFQKRASRHRTLHKISFLLMPTPHHGMLYVDFAAQHNAYQFIAGQEAGVHVG